MSTEYLRFPTKDGLYVLYQYTPGLSKWVDSIVEVSDLDDDSAVIMEPGSDMATRVTSSPSKRWVALDLPPPPDETPTPTKKFTVLVKRVRWLRVEVEAASGGAARHSVRDHYNELNWEDADEDDPAIEDVEEIAQ